MPSRLSSLCSSSDIPKVVTTKACVSPLVNKAEPCVLGKTPTSHLIFLTSAKPLPSILFLSFSIAVLTISFSRDFNCDITWFSVTSSFSLNNSLHFLSISEIAVDRFFLSISLNAFRKSPSNSLVIFFFISE